jgi:hypothetical protein
VAIRPAMVVQHPPIIGPVNSEVMEVMGEESTAVILQWEFIAVVFGAIRQGKEAIIMGKIMMLLVKEVMVAVFS